MTESQNRYQEEMNQGHTAAWDQDWQTAADHYRQALEETPDDPNGLVSLGLALYELGSFDQSIQFYSRAIEVSPEDPLAFEKVSQLYELLGQKEEATTPALQASELYLKESNIAKSIECLVRVIRVDPENLPAHSRLALIYERTGRKQQSVAEFLIVASLMQHKDDIENATQAVQHALTILPESREAQDAFSLIDQGQPLPKPVSIDVAQPQLEKMESKLELETLSEQKESELDPVAEAHQIAISTLANLVFEQNKSGGELSFPEISASDQTNIGRVASQSFTNQGDPNKVFIHLQRAMIFQGQDSEESAAEELEKAVELGLDHPAAYFELGYIRSSGDRLESAIRYLQRALEDPDYGLAARLLIARAMRFTGRLSEAASNYLEGLRLADAQLVPADQAADMLRMYKPIIEAEAKQTDPDVKNKLCDMIEDLLLRPGWQTYLNQARGDFQIDVEGVPAIPVGELLSNPQGDRIVESVRQINQYARSRHLRSAMEVAYFAIQFAPTYLPLHTYMGELLLKQEHLPQAIEKFGAIAKTYRARGESLHASKILQRLIKAAPMDLDARIQLISLQEEMGQYEQAVEEKINLAGVYYNLADLSRAREVYLDAFRIAQDAKTNKDLKVKILYHLADIELQSLDWKHAEEIYTQIQSIKPDDYQATEKLIELKLRSGQNQQAQNDIDDYISYMEVTEKELSITTFLDEMVDEYPDRLFLRQKKAQLYQKNGQTEQAIQAYDELGELLLESGDKKGAIDAIENILALDPPDKSQYQDLINGLLEQG